MRADSKRGVKKSDAKGDPRIGAKTFERIIGDGNEHKKEDVIAKLVVTGGVKEATAASSYLTWAKRTGEKGQPRDGMNPFPFTLTERQGRRWGKVRQGPLKRIDALCPSNAKHLPNHLDDRFLPSGIEGLLHL